MGCSSSSQRAKDPGETEATIPIEVDVPAGGPSAGADDCTSPGSSKAPGHSGAETNACKEFDPHVKLCKFGCGKPVAPGLTNRGNPFDTCCRTCALNPGLGMHALSCGGGAASPSTLTALRPVCPNASKCRQRDDAHLQTQAHPLDLDYAECCAAGKVQGEPLTLRVLFDWTDADGSGKLSRQELEGTLGTIQKLCGDALPRMTEQAWQHLDEDGNGVVNFSEFATWAGPRLGLPLGMKHLVQRAGSTESAGVISCPCGVMGCPCESFSGEDTDKKCKTCKHKRGAHKTRESGEEVPFPDYWENNAGKFNNIMELKTKDIDEFQSLLDKTYRDIWTRDRKNHNPTCPNVPKGFKVTSVSRNENSHGWVEYGCRRAAALSKVSEGDAIDVMSDVKSMVAWREIGGAKADRLAHECNEWYLFHGTNPEAAKSICSTDFKVSRAGSNTGTLYGKGLYFAESITKADEYAKPDGKGKYAVLLCRVIGGKVRYTDDPNPDPEDLVHSCIDGPYDSVLGDREKAKGTFKEFVLFDSEDVYPEYIIQYTRVT